MMQLIVGAKAAAWIGAMTAPGRQLSRARLGAMAYVIDGVGYVNRPIASPAEDRRC